MSMIYKQGNYYGTSSYNDLNNKPTIEGQTLSGDLSLEDIGDVPIDDEDIISMVNTAFGN